jgi:nucleoside 2-deoxyribosyltransferase
MAKLECFVIMPFRVEFDRVFALVQDAVKGALPDKTFECRWLKDDHAAGRITDDILDALYRSTLCVADLSGSNANVMWETGYAMALGKPTILLCQDLQVLPFDLRVHRVLEYRLQDLEGLRHRLSEAVRQTLAKHAIRLEGPASSTKLATGLTIAVTGTMRVSPARATHRIQTVLHPYLGLDASWYCGSQGGVDEIALSLLLANDERVVTVGYHRYDMSETVRGMISRGKLGFVDASMETIPRGLQGFNEREALFMLKSDLIILFWDGDSTGTRELVRQFQEEGKNLLVAFI